MTRSGMGLDAVERINWLAQIAADRRITEAGLRVAIVLAEHQNHKTGRLDPSVPTIARETGMTEPGVRGGLNKLSEAGFIQRTRSDGWRNSYRLIFLEPLNDGLGVNDDLGVNDGLGVNNGPATPKQPLPQPHNDGLPKQGNITGEETGNHSASLHDAAPMAAGSKPDAHVPQVLLTRRKRKLHGERLDVFLQFWEAFGYKKGKAEAADAWLDIRGLTPELVEKEIIPAAERECAGRDALIAGGRTPKMAQGWLSGRRWEDEPMTGSPSGSRHNSKPSVPDYLVNAI